jgi:amino-acid N-acetyltransferase
VLRAGGRRRAAAEGDEEAGSGLVLRVSAAGAARIEVAGATDRAPIEALLRAAALPTADLGSATDLRLWAARDAGRVVGAIGLERHGTVGLLRSLVVAPELRGHGLGGLLVDALEHDARAAGLDSLVLLTQTAETFFAHRGYARIERAAAPHAVQESTEFRSLCPASAATMIKVLA